MDEGNPIAYTVLVPGVPVYADDGERVGSVERVLADTSEDIFHGIVIATEYGERLVLAEQVRALHQLGVNLDLAATAIASLPSPGPLGTSSPPGGYGGGPTAA
ncbi:MAG TPA: PRC-barrel domain-containing protein [Solirubrobacteraceae bacterium]|nr:PRC-barrel domain-containing protein [Solirubrobacteraceae bacterium]